MAMFSTQNPWAFAFGLLGNLISFAVFLAPLPTFYRICKKKSTEGFQSIPYVVAQFSAMLWIYYATMKPDASLLITINALGCVIETVYLALYVSFARKQARMYTLRLLLLNFGGFCSILLLSHFLAEGLARVRVLGWVCVAFNASVFAAPLSILTGDTHQKCRVYAFLFIFFLTLSAITWFFYGLFLRDFYIAIPNTLGFVFGILQMILYAIYKNYKPVVEDVKVPEHTVDITKLSTSITGEQSVTKYDHENSEINNTDDDKNDQHDITEDHHEKSEESCNQEPLNKC